LRMRQSTEMLIAAVCAPVACLILAPRNDIVEFPYRVRRSHSHCHEGENESEEEMNALELHCDLVACSVVMMKSGVPMRFIYFLAAGTDERPSSCGKGCPRAPPLGTFSHCIHECRLEDGKNRRVDRLRTVNLSICTARVGFAESDAPRPERLALHN